VSLTKGFDSFQRHEIEKWQKRYCKGEQVGLRSPLNGREKP